MRKRRRPGAVRPPTDGGETFLIIETGTPEYLIPMPKPQRVKPLPGDPDSVIHVPAKPIEQGEEPTPRHAASPPL